MRISVTDGLLVDEAYEFSPDTCILRANGRVLCTSADRATKASFRPKKAPGEYRFKITMKHRSLPATVAGPVNLLFGDASFERDGMNANCIDKTMQVVCRN